MTSVKNSKDTKSVVLEVASTKVEGTIEELECDFVFCATGYVRNSHERILEGTRDLLPVANGGREALFPVGRDYRVMYDGEKIDDRCGVWLQGCNESTHGVSDLFLNLLHECILKSFMLISDAVE